MGQLFQKAERVEPEIKEREPLNIELLELDETYKKIHETINVTKLFHPDTVKKCTYVDLLCINTHVHDKQEFTLDKALVKDQTNIQSIYKQFESFIETKDLLSTLKEKLNQWSPQQPLTILAISCISNPNSENNAKVRVKYFRLYETETKHPKAEYVLLEMQVCTSMLEDPKTRQIIEKYMFRPWPDNRSKMIEIGFMLRGLLKDNEKVDTEKLESLFKL